MAKYPKVNYIGNKEKLSDWILSEMPVKEGTVLDLFAGGCSVSYALKAGGYRVISNDILYADYVIARALVENQDQRLEEDIFARQVSNARVAELAERFAFLGERLYYPKEVRELARLAAISETLDGDRRYLFLALLRRAMIRKLPYSRMNVPWNQIQRLRDEDYSYAKYGRKRAYHNQTFESHMRENIDAYNQAVFPGAPCRACRLDALDLIRRMEAVDVVYMDPPYPSTMNNYDSFYGLYDEMFDKKKKHMDFTQRSLFLDNMAQILEALRGKTAYVLLSQNTRSRPGPEEILELLGRYGSVTMRQKQHNYQVTGKENKNASKELLFLLHMEA